MSKIKNLRLWAMIISILILLAVIMIPISVGDGGSKYKMLERTGLSYISVPQTGLAQTSFGVVNRAKISTCNIHELLISITNIFSFGYNTAILCVIYSIIFLIGLFLLIGAAEDKNQSWHKWVTTISALLILCDFAYTAYFNSLYSQPLFMALFVLICALTVSSLKNGFKPSYAFCLIICGAALAAIDTLSAVIAILIGIAIIIINTKNSNKAISIITGAAIIICGISFAAAGRSPDYEKNLYNAVFYGVAEFGSVQELGLDKELDILKGTYYTDEIVSEYSLNEKLYGKIGYGDVIGYYISHPASLIKAMKSEAANGFVIQAKYEGNFVNKPEKLAVGFNLYSFIKGKFFPNTLIFVLLFFALYFVLVAALITKGKDHRRPLLKAMLMLGVCGLVSFIAPYIQTGIVEMHHSMFTFYLMFDMMLLSSIIGGSYILRERNQETKEKYGVNQ